LIDVEPADILVGYNAQNVLAIRRIAAFGAEVDQEVVSKDLHVHIGDDGATGWVDDALSYRIVVGGRRAIVPERATAVYERRDGRWIEVQGHVSYPVPEEDWFASRPQSAKLPTSAASGVFAEDVRQLVAGLIADRPEALPAIAADDEAVLIAPHAILRGR